MILQDIFNNKATKPKEKTETIAKSILENKVKINDLIEFAKSQKDPVKATCIEAIEYATEKKPETANEKVIEFAINLLSEKAPRIKWEASRVIANTVHLFPKKQSEIIKNLLTNTNHEGTVVRWSTALAFSKIMLTKSPESNKIISQLKSIAEKEEKNSIKKIYLTALKGK
jgi:hypothetical protein